jgi:geranylgeranyl diphosphate synthase, type II
MTASIDEIKRSVEHRLQALTPADEASGGRLADAMRYSLLAPAKRVRAILTVLSAEHCGADVRQAIDAAASLELVHAASLVLDDLPAMDDAGMRRGRPTCHRAFGEDIAILAAIALMNLGYQVAATDAGLSAEQRVRLSRILARSIGTEGLTGGQVRDLSSRPPDAGRSHPDTALLVAEIERTHGLKTSALFAAAAEAGAVVADARPDSVDAMVEFGWSLGLAFQAFDDVLDAHATAVAIGKDVARDTTMATIVDLLGRAGAEVRAREHVRRAMAALDRTAAAKDSRLGRYVESLLAQLTAPLAATAQS